MYIDHISGSLQNLNNSMRGLQGLAELDEQRRKRQLQASIEAKDRGDNPTAEKLFLESQRGLLGNIFEKDAQEWEIDNPYRGKEASLQSLIETPEQQQVQSLKDINAVNELKKIYGNNTEALNKQLGLMGLTQTPQDIISGYDQKVAQNKQISADNIKREAYNKSLANQNEYYEGTEDEKQQKLLDNAFNAIQNAGSTQDKLRQYMQYRTIAKAIADYHRRRDFSPHDAAFFGIGSGGKGAGTGSKMEDYHYGRPGDKNLSLVQIPKSLLGNQKRIQQWIKQNYPDYYSEDKGLISRAGTDQGGFLNEQQQLKAEQDKMLLEQAKNDQIERQIDQRDGIFTRRSTAEKEYIKELAAQGLTIVTDPVTGLKKTVPIGSDVAQKDEEPLW